MKEQVTDISKVLQNMTEEMRLLRETVSQQYTEIVKLNRNINALNLQIRKKDTELTMPKFTSHFSGYCYWIGLHIFYLLPEQLYTPMETLLIRFT